MTRLQLSQKRKLKLDRLETLKAREQELKERQTQFETDVTEAETEEELDALDDQATALEADKKALEEEKVQLEQDVQGIESKIETIEKELEAEEPTEQERKIMSKLITRGTFAGMQRTEAEALIQRDEVKSFLTEIRGAMSEKRAISGGDYTIPEVLIGLVREQVYGLSKLAGKVWKVSLKGEGRYNIAGAIPEAVWTEMCANLNELDLAFNQQEVDGYKVGGFVAVCNALLEDSDLALAQEVLNAISQAIAIALDKAILYGKGTKMPLGVVTALEAVNGTPNLIGVADTNKGATFYEALVTAFGKAKGHGSTGGKWYAMNETTFAKLQVKALSMNAAGAIVTGQQMTMPILGGEIILIDSVADGTIIGGYGQHYLLAERKNVQLARSEHVQFIQDNTVFKGTARYDGKPVFTDAFVAVLIGNGTDVPASTDVTFAADTANA